MFEAFLFDRCDYRSEKLAVAVSLLLGFFRLILSTLDARIM